MDCRPFGISRQAIQLLSCCRRHTDADRQRGFLHGHRRQPLHRHRNEQDVQREDLFARRTARAHGFSRPAHHEGGRSECWRIYRWQAEGGCQINNVERQYQNWGFPALILYKYLNTYL